MSKDVYIFEITQATFASAVLDNSHQIPVIVEFMAVWSEHCMAVEGIFSHLAREFASEFIFAKVDVEEQPELQAQYQIKNIPTVLVFQNGEVKRIEIGTLNEDQARALLNDLGISRASDALRLQAREKHIAGATNEAVMLLTQAIKQDPANTRVAMDMVQIFIDIQALDNAEGLFNRLPTRDRESDLGKSLNDQLMFAKAAARTAGIDKLQQQLNEQPNDLAARLDLAICLMAQHDGKAAMDQLLQIIEIDSQFRDGAAREMLVSIIRMFKLTQPEMAQEYQRKLSGLLAK